MLNLMVLLLHARRFIPKQEIRQILEGYHGMSDATFNRTFSRDKEALRKLGVPIVTTPQAHGHDAGYRIHRQDFELPALEFTPDEATVIAMASRVLQGMQAARHAASGVTKLWAGGIDALGAREVPGHDSWLSLQADEPTFDAIYEALVNRQAVRFTYSAATAGAASHAPSLREVEPWRLVWRHNARYLLGWDRTRQDVRVFKLSRIHNDIRALEDDQPFTMPPESEIDAREKLIGAPTDGVIATLAIREGYAPELRRQGTPLETAIAPRQGPVIPEGYGWWQVTLDAALAPSVLASYGDEVIVHAPDSLREAVRDHLQAMVRHYREPIPSQWREATLQPVSHKGEAVDAVVTSDSTSQVERLLALIPWLRAHGSVPLADIAEHFDVPVRTVRRDLNVAWFVGLPGGLPGDLIEIDIDDDGDQAMVSLRNADFLSRPMKLRYDEAVSLLVGIDVISQWANGDMAQAAQSARDKLSSMARRVVSLELPGGDPQVRQTVASAVGQHRLRLSYEGATKRQITHPVVDPVRLEARDSALYLHAWKCDAREWRTYRVDRIAAASIVGPSEPHPEPPSMDDWWQGAPTLTAALAPSSRWVKEYYPCSAECSLPDGTTLVRLPVGSVERMRALFTQLGDQARVIEPEQAVQMMERTAEQALAHHGCEPGPLDTPDQPPSGASSDI